MHSNIISNIEKEQMKSNIVKILTGDFVTVEIYIFDKIKNKIQIFTGIVISIKKKNICSSITVRKYSNGEGIERTFFIHSKIIKNIKVNRHSKVRKSKLYFLRKSENKSIKIKEKFIKNK